MRMPATPPSMSELMGKTGLRLDRVWRSDAGRPPPDSYLHWSKLRFRTPPDGLSHEEWWLATKLARASARHELPLVDKLGASFAFSDSAYLYRMLHQADRDAGGRIEMPPDLVGPDSRDRYLVSALARKARQLREAERLLGGQEANALLNYRQRALLAHMRRHPDTAYTIAGHRRSHDVTYETARTDLLKLVDLGLLDQTRQGRAFAFHRPADFDKRLGDRVGAAPPTE